MLVRAVLGEAVLAVGWAGSVGLVRARLRELGCYVFVCLFVVGCFFFSCFFNHISPFSMFQVDASFDPEDAKKVLHWIQAATGQQFPIEESNERYKVMENFYKTLKDGRLLCL